MKTVVLLSVLALSACTWEFATDQHGKTQIRQKYPTGAGVYYTNGAASQNTHYHEMRPQQHVVLPD
ncbi:hypothetical protein [Alysiella crassa]|uniref:Lipoprotein n=1 Tax=Alysiella crassa TaxID=153491 RepID=A0A376BLA1_9NEIS|nr:hypothetical protein [Alysiella crassa]UOP07270.1 hypothetical protein LVJ80_02155 [Alysiella crassa]SSY70557.1 Uncharacterised protein [Alysiella crassa]